MPTEDTVDSWKQIYEEQSDWFPMYFVSMPPHRDTLIPVYYKVYTPTGPVFWRREGDDESRETTLLDMFMEEKNGFGVQEVDRCDEPPPQWLVVSC